MKKKLAALSLAGLALLLLAATLWYTRPLTLQKLCPEIDLSQCSSITVYFGITPYVEMERLVLEPDNPSFSPLLKNLQEQSFSRSLTSLLPQRTRTVRTEEGDFRWELILNFDDTLVMPDGNGYSGQLLHILNFFGSLEVFYALNGRTWQVSTQEQDAWLTQILELSSNALSPV